MDDPGWGSRVDDAGPRDGSDESGGSADIVVGAVGRIGGSEGSRDGSSSTEVVVVVTGAWERELSVVFEGLGGLRMLERRLSIGLSGSWAEALVVVTIPEGANKIPDVLVVGVDEATDTGALVDVVFAARGGALELGSSLSTGSSGIRELGMIESSLDVRLVGNTTIGGSRPDEAGPSEAGESEAGASEEGTGPSAWGVDVGSSSPEEMGPTSAGEEVEPVVFATPVDDGGGT